MIKVGDSVKARSGDFSGRVLASHGAEVAFSYQSLPENLNIAVFAVLNESSGEIRHFTREGLLLIE